MTIQQHASFDSSAAELNATSKLVKAWESKNAKNAAKAGGISMMALSLAACGGSSTTVTTPVVEDPVVVTPASQVVAATTGVDTVSGGDAADTFNAGLSAANMTLGSLDTFDGKGGADTLNVAVNGDVTPGAISNIETINVTASANTDLNMSNASGYTALNDVGSTALVTYTNIEAATVALSVSDTALGADFAYKANALTGTADTVNVTVANVSAGSVVLNGAIETVNLTSSVAASSFTLDTDATTLNISGSADVTLAAGSTGMDKTTVVNAAEATGKVTLTHDNTTAAQGVTITGGSGADAITLTGTLTATDSVSGGAGNDTITFTDDLADADTVDGGAGTDTLAGNRADVVALTAAAKITNFEGLTISDTLTNAVVLNTATIQAGIDTVTLAAGSTAGTVTFEAGAKALVLGTASAGALTVNDTGLAVTDTLDITTSKTADSTNDKAMTINGFETVSLSTNTATAKTVAAITVNGDPDADGVNTAATLNLSGAASLTHSGVVTLGVAAGAGTIDASEMTGAYVQSGASIGASTIKGGAGADTLYGSAGNATTITGGAGIDTIYGGTAVDTISGDAGNDIIYGSGGNDILNGGAGDDNFIMASAELTSTVTVDGGAGTDSITIEDLVAVVDADFTLVSNVETLTAGSTGLSATLGAEAMEAGINTVTFSAAGAVVETVTVAKEFTSALTVNIDQQTTPGTGDNQFDASASVSAVNFVADVATDITDAVSAGDLLLKGGTTAGDKLTTVGGTFIAADLQSVTGVETFIVSDDTSTSFTISDSNATATQSLTLDGRAIINTANTFTVVGTAENDGVITVHGSAGADAITGTVTATLGDTIYGYGGADIITVAVDAMQTADVIDGGVGSDTLKISGTGTLVDADLTGVTNIEKFEHTGTSTLTTLGTQYMESGSVDITLAAQTNALNLDAITNDQVLNLKAGTDTVDASSMTGALNVKFAEASLTTADTLTGGTGTADTLTITYSGTANVSGDFDNVTGFEKIVAATNAAGGLAILDAMTTAASSLELDFTALTSAIATVDMALESNAGITLNTGGGNDVITMSISSVGDTISSGAGDDGITTAIAQLTSADTVDGGAGTDTVTFSDAGAVGDADFTNVSNIEALTLGNGTNTIVLGAEYAGTGSVTINAGTGADSITLGSGVTTAQTVNFSLAAAGADTLVATGATGVITATMDSDDLTAADTLTGGSASDILTITGAANQVTAAEMANVTSFETIKVGSNATWDVLLNDANTVSGVINVDATLATSAAVTFSGKAENDGTVVYVGGGGVDTVIGTDTTATGDTIGGGAGADVITGGAGSDTITGGAGADLFHYLAVADSTGTAKDSITDFTSGTDFISVVLDNSTNTSGQTYDATIQTAAAGTAAVQAGMSGSIGQTFFDTTNNVMVVNANGDNLVTTLDYQIGLNAAATAANTVAEGDIRFVITGGSGIDTIVAGSGDDTITGGAGADLITGGAGDDALVGGAGIDKYKFSDTNGKDTITFVRNEDLLDFSGVTAQGTIAEASITNDAGTTLGATTLTSNTTVYYIDTDATELGTATTTSVTDWTSTTAIATWMNLDDGIVAGGTAGDTNYFVINDGNDTDAAYVIKHTDDGDATVTIEAAELEIIAVLNSTVAGAVDAADGVIA